MEHFVCLDVGGTEIKGAPVDLQGNLLGEIRHDPACADRDRETVLDHFADLVDKYRQGTLAGLRLAFPGPFDYEKGICLLRGLAKYDSLYGVNIRQELARRVGIAPEKIAFANDGTAFALGEMGFGEAAGVKRALFICIGTGCGSAFGVDGRPAPAGFPGVPENGFVYSAPYRESCVDDYLSRRGLMALSQEMLGTPLDGKGLADLANQGDKGAVACFHAFGERIAEALTPFVDGFRPETVCFGGQITRSGEFFLSPMASLCRARQIHLYVTPDTSARALQGLTRL